MSPETDLVEDFPLALAEARLVARQIRDTKRPVCRVYWAWVLEKLCDRLERAEALLRPPGSAGETSPQGAD